MQENNLTYYIFIAVGELQKRKSPGWSSEHGWLGALIFTPGISGEIDCCINAHAL
jgi:hypothetical protein